MLFGKRKVIKMMVLILSLGLCLSSTAFASKVLEETQKSFANVAKTVYPSVVTLTPGRKWDAHSEEYFVPHEDPVFGDMPQSSRVPDRRYSKVRIGSGVIIDPRGYILTNQHLLDDMEADDVLNVRLFDGRHFEGVVKGRDPRYDIAIVKIEAYEDLPAIKLGDSSKVDVGNWAIAIGNPYGFAFDDAMPTMTVGVVGALNRSLPGFVGMKRSYTNLIQTDAAINVGNSGGPLTDIYGNVIGINVAIVSSSGGSEGLGFAIPSNLCQDLVAEVIEGREVLYSWLGVNVQNINSSLADYFKYPYNSGVLVIKCVAHSPGRIGGVREKDIITYFGDKQINRVEDLLNAINSAKVGQKVTLRLYRDGYEREVDVIMGSRPKTGGEAKKTRDALLWKGMKVDNVTYQRAHELGIPSLKGAVVEEVVPGSSADRAGISVGEVIVSINDKTVQNIDDYYSHIAGISGEVLVKTLRGFFVLKQ